VSKYSWIFVIFFILVFATILVDLTVDVSSSVQAGIDYSEVEGYRRFQIFKTMGTFFRIVGFRLSGLPLGVNAVLNLLIFYPLSAILLYLGAEILKDLVPMT